MRGKSHINRAIGPGSKFASLEKITETLHTPRRTGIILHFTFHLTFSLSTKYLQ